MPSFVYVLRSDRNGRYGTGFSSAPKVRLIQHNAGKVRATRHLRPWILVYREECLDATSARKRGFQMRAMKSRAYLEKLIAEEPERCDLPDASGALTN